MNFSRAIRLLTLSLILMLVAASCNTGGDDEDDAENAVQSPEEIIEEVASTFQETESARFTLEIDGSIGIDAEGMLELGAVQGEIERPSNARADASIQFAGSSVSMEIVAVDGQMYLRNILTGNWERAPSDLEYDPARIFNEEDGVPAILEQIDDLELEAEESINGQDAYHLSGRVDAEVVAALTGDFFEGDTLGVDLWAAQDDYRLLRVELHDDEATEPVSWELNLTDHDEPVDISAPDVN